MDIVLVIKSVSHSQTDSTNAHFCPVHYTGGERLTQSCVIHLLGADVLATYQFEHYMRSLCLFCISSASESKNRDCYKSLLH